ncbi:hypothetical protein Tsubulata_031043 [Turnera subulata]|uniref:Uncharacterized protein n=1 Tax=Turnera subulata TaxID=218843 RepID=A0A9Q0GF98_9ROSI|nr:hypothetical protein Tsubulata_031043 [Turnera subulata]
MRHLLLLHHPTPGEFKLKGLIKSLHALAEALYKHHHWSGLHMDVVTANPDYWNFDPFSMSIDGDKLQGFGTTDCLRLVAHFDPFIELMKKLGQEKPALRLYSQ